MKEPYMSQKQIAFKQGTLLTNIFVDHYYYVDKIIYDSLVASYIERDCVVLTEIFCEI